jgi:hypothetical protein
MCEISCKANDFRFNTLQGTKDSIKEDDTALISGRMRRGGPFHGHNSLIVVLQKDRKGREPSYPIL